MITEDELILLIEEAIELFEEAFEENKNFSDKVYYNDFEVSVQSLGGTYTLSFDSKDVSVDYSFEDIDEELDVDLIFDEINHEFFS